MIRHKIQMLVPLLTSLLAATPALAHPGHMADGAAAGLLHPLLGPDHLLAMLGIGLWAAQRGGSALWRLPVTFVAALAVGGFVGAGVGTLPDIEAMIALTVLVLGVAIATDARLPAAAGLGAVALFGAVHGMAHGAEVPADTSVWLFGMGFVATSIALHGAGIGTALLLRATGLLRPIGLFFAAAGAALLGTL